MNRDALQLTLMLALLAVAFSLVPLQRWCMQDHVSLRTNTIITGAIIGIAAAIIVTSVLLG